MTRDPRTDPAHGDTILSPAGVDRLVDAVYGSPEYRWPIRFHERRWRIDWKTGEKRATEWTIERWTTIAAWRRWAAGGEVLAVGEET